LAEIRIEPVGVDHALGFDFTDLVDQQVVARLAPGQVGRPGAPRHPALVIAGSDDQIKECVARPGGAQALFVASDSFTCTTRRISKSPS